MSSTDGRTMVLLGAGASADAALPLTSALASAIVAKANEADDGRGLPPGPPDWVRALNAVYAGMVAHQGAHGGNPLRAVNVETLISAIRLLQDRDSHEVAPFVATWSPALSRFDSVDIPSSLGDKILDATNRSLLGSGGMNGQDITNSVAAIARAAVSPNLEKPFKDAETFILRSLVDLLGNVSDVEYLQPLVDLARSQPGGLDVVTLNYDLTVETIAAESNMRVVRGIETWCPGEPLRFPSEDGVLNLMKLHGSLDWRRAPTDRNLPSELTPPQLEVVEPNAIVEGNGRNQLSWIVVGDREKLATDGPTLALNFAARVALTATTHLAVIGYSFGDAHINAMIRDWLASDATRTISVLDLQWPRERYYREAKDFRSLLLTTYGRDHDRENRPLLPRMVPMEGTARDQLEAVLKVRPKMPPARLVTAEATRTDEHLRIDVTWHGNDLTDASIWADTPKPTETHSGVEGMVRLQASLPIDPQGGGIFGRVLRDAIAGGSTVTVYTDAAAPLPLEIRVEGSSIVGGRSVSVLTKETTQTSDDRTLTAARSWSDLLAYPRHSAATMRGRDIPQSPGVYAWFRDDECVYVGMASVLRERLGKHLGKSLDLSRSTLRASVAVRQLGISRGIARSRPTVMTEEQVQVVNDWIRGCDIAWAECDDVGAADELERRLRREWMPPINLV